MKTSDEIQEEWDELDKKHEIIMIEYRESQRKLDAKWKEWKDSVDKENQEENTP